MSMTAAPPTASRRKRGITAGLSAVGAGAGALGLAVGAKEIRRHGWRGTPRLTRALIPVEAAGLTGELMATKILHADAKQQPKEQTMVKSLGMDQGNGHGRRIVEVPVSKERVSALRRAGRALSQAGEDFSTGRAARGTKILEPTQPYGGPRRMRRPDSAGEASGNYSTPAAAGYHSNAIIGGTTAAAVGGYNYDRYKKHKVAKGEGRLVVRGLKAVKPKNLNAAGETLAEQGARMRGQLGYHLEQSNVSSEVKTGVRKGRAGPLLEQTEHLGSFFRKPGFITREAGSGNLVERHENQLRKGRIAGLAGGAASVPAAGGGVVYAHKRRERVRKFEMVRPKEERKAVRRSKGFWAAQAAGLTAVPPLVHYAHTGNKASLAAGVGLGVGTGVAGGYAAHRTGNRYRASVGQAPRNYWTGQPKKVETSKARRFDPEADRQRRLGTYAGLAGGGALLTADRFGRELHVGSSVADMSHVKGHTPGATKTVRAIGLKRGRRGLAFGAATLGLAGIAGGSVRRGISERNTTWN